MTNVLIVGFGNIGLRHFQSIADHKKIKKIYIYDKNYKKIINFKKEYKNSSKIVILRNLKTNNNKFILSILSTNSEVRFSLFKKVVNNFKIKNFIFEKIIFQKPREYDLAKEMIKKKKLKCWVNCPRRTWSIFKNLKKKILKKYSLSIIVKGYNWGLLSNSIHFIDLFAFLTKTKNFTFFLDKLSRRLYKSKRENFYETKGEILIKNNYGDQILLSDKKNSKNRDLIFALRQKNFRFYFNQNNQKNIFKVPLQSKETVKHLNNILKDRRCTLPSFIDTYQFHKLYLENFENFLEKKSNKKNYLIT